MRQKLPHTFPVRLILVVSLILCLCGVVTITLAVLSTKHRTWGYDWGTGFWCGSLTFAAGVCGSIAAHARDICSMKTFMIFSVIGGVVSLAMLALSVGGLHSDSGMYSGSLKEDTQNMTVVVHSGCLGISILQLTLFVFADGICIYYLFVDKGLTLFSLKTTPGNKPVPVVNKDFPRIGKKSGRNSSSHNQKSRSKHRKQKKKKKNESQSESIDDIETPLQRNRDSLVQKRQNDLPTSSPIRNHVNRNSFTTFGHSSVAELESLIVHLDEGSSVLNITTGNNSQLSGESENHYAQGFLFGTPVPIDEDDELPPYEAVESNPYKVSNVANYGLCNCDLDDTNTSVKQAVNGTSVSAEEAKSLVQSKHKVPTHTRQEIPHGRGDYQMEHNIHSTVDTLNSIEPVYAAVQPRRSVSADLLSEDSPFSHSEQSHPQGVLYGDFAHYGDKLTPRSRRTQSLRSIRPDREKRLERRNRALSAEIKLTKNHLLTQGEQCGLGIRTSSTESSNSGLYAGNRMMPTKFSLRTPVRQVGTPYIQSAIPVKAISTLPLFQPPPKPPRVHSVTIDDLKGDIDDDPIETEDISVDNTDSVFVDENKAEHISAIKINNDGHTVLGDDLSDTSKILYNTIEENIARRNTKLACDENKESDRLSTHKENVLSMNNSEKVLKTEGNTDKVPASKLIIEEGPIIRCEENFISPMQSVLKKSSEPNDESMEKISKTDFNNQNSMSIISSPLIKQKVHVLSETKDKNIPIPKVRTSIKSSKESDKLPIIDSTLEGTQSSKHSTDAFGQPSGGALVPDKSKVKGTQNQLDKDDLGVLKVDLPHLKQMTGYTTPPTSIVSKKEKVRNSDKSPNQNFEITDIQTQSVHVTVADSPVITARRSRSIEYKGARPKTTFSATKALIPSPGTSNVSNSKFTKQGQIRPNMDLKQDHRFQNLISSSKSKRQPPDVNVNKPTPLVRGPLPSSVHSLNHSPSSRVSSQTSSLSSASGSSQGVLHLPQTQFSRQVAQQQPSNTVNNNAQINVPNNNNTQANNSTDSLLISRLL